MQMLRGDMQAMEYRITIKLGGMMTGSMGSDSIEMTQTLKTAPGKPGAVFLCPSIMAN